MGNPDSEEHNQAIARSLRLRLRLRLPLQFVFSYPCIRIVYNRDVETNGGIRRYPEFPECREINAHAQTVCTRPSLSRGRPGNEATPPPPLSLFPSLSFSLSGVCVCVCVCVCACVCVCVCVCTCVCVCVCVYAMCVCV